MLPAITNFYHIKGSLKARELAKLDSEEVQFLRERAHHLLCLVTEGNEWKWV